VKRTPSAAASRSRTCGWAPLRDRSRSSEPPHVRRQIGVRAAYGFSAATYIPAMRRALPVELSYQDILASGSVFVHGFRAVDVPKKSARHRGLSARSRTKLYHLGDGRQSSSTTGGVKPQPFSLTMKFFNPVKIIFPFGPRFPRSSFASSWPPACVLACEISANGRPGAG
jgi:hypothetical protein